jgi:hypothetical protein
MKFNSNTLSVVSVTVCLYAVSIFVYKDSSLSDGEIVGLFHQSLYEMRIGIAKGNKSAADKWANCNSKQFDELKKRGIISMVKYDGLDSNDFSSFHKSLDGFTFYRPGYSNEGGQWPIGIEYVETFLLELIPNKYGGLH